MRWLVFGLDDDGNFDEAAAKGPNTAAYLQKHYFLETTTRQEQTVPVLDDDGDPVFDDDGEPKQRRLCVLWVRYNPDIEAELAEKSAKVEKTEESKDSESWETEDDLDNDFEDE